MPLQDVVGLRFPAEGDGYIFAQCSVFRTSQRTLLFHFIDIYFSHIAPNVRKIHEKSKRAVFVLATVSRIAGQDAPFTELKPISSLNASPTRLPNNTRQSARGAVSKQTFEEFNLIPLKTVIALCVLIVGFMASGAPSTQDIQHKTDFELIDLLTNNDSAVRSASLMVLALRFNNPEAIVVMSPFPTQTPHTNGVTLPDGLLEKTASLAKTDNDLKVQIAAVMALEMFKYRTNTTPILTELLQDPTCIIRIRAAQALIDFASDYHEPISDTVVTTLISCLDSTNSPDDIWQAEESLGDLGLRAKQSMPFLVKLKHSGSPQVREYAREAIWKIEKGLTEQNRTQSSETATQP